MSHSNYTYQQIVLNSDDVASGNRFQFNQAIDDSEFFQLKAAIIPFTYYVFTSPNYTSCTINGTTVTWAAGNYTASEWISVVVAQLTNITITYSAITNKLTFVHGLGTTITITFSATEKAYELLGMNAGTNTNGTASFTTPKTVNFSGPNFLYLRSNTLGSIFNNSSMFYSASTRLDRNTSNIIAMIPINVNRNDIVFYENMLDIFFSWPSYGNKQIDLYCTLGNRTEIMDFNGNTFQITLHGYTTQKDHFKNNQ